MSDDAAIEQDDKPFGMNDDMAAVKQRIAEAKGTIPDESEIETPDSIEIQPEDKIDNTQLEEPAQQEESQAQSDSLQYDELKAKYDALVQKNRNEGGKRGAELERLRTEVQQLTTLNSSLMNEVSFLKESHNSEKKLAGTQATSIEDNDRISALLSVLTDEQKEDYEDLLIPVAKMIEASRNDGSTNQLQRDVQQLKNQKEVDRFYSEVEKLAAGFTQVNGMPEYNVPPIPEWIEFLNTPRFKDDPDQETWMDYANRVRTPAAYASAFNAFRKPHSSPDSHSPAGETQHSTHDRRPPSLDDLAQPSQVSGFSKRGAQDGKPPILRRADYDALMIKASQPGSPHELRQKLRIYQQAAIDGRLR